MTVGFTKPSNMKTSVVLFTTLVTLTFIDLALAGKGNRGRNRNNDGDRCRYDRTSGEWSECDATTSKITKTVTLKADQPASCDQTKTMEKPCDRLCKYERAAWSECDTNTGMRSLTRTLKAGSPDTCSPTVSKEKPCRGKARKALQKQKRKARQSRSKTYTCKYATGNWSECDDVTRMQVVTLTLTKGNPTICGERKLLNKSCEEGKDGCKYDRQVSDCVDGKKTISYTLKEGPETCPDPKSTKEKPCGRGGKAKNRKSKKEEKKAQRKARRQERRNGNNNDDA